MKVLLIDDNLGSLNEAVGSLRSSGMQVECMTGISDLNRFLQKGEPFDLVILDWLLDGSDSKHARGCLDLLEEHRFVPVVIYTEQIALYNSVAEQVRFPASCLHSFGKDEVSQANIGKVVSDWLAGFLPGRMSSDWRRAVRFSVEKVLYEMARMDDAGIQGALTTMTKSETGGSPDVDHALDLLQRMSTRYVSGDKELKSCLEGLLRAAKNPSAVGEKRIWQHHMYYSPNDNVVRAGDLVRLHIDGKNAGLCVVLTPACDLDQFHTDALRLARLDNPPATTAGKLPAGLYPLPYVPTNPGALTNLCVNFHETFFVRNQSVLAELTRLRVTQPERKALPEVHMTYDHEYTDCADRKTKLARIVRLDDPYRSDLFQKFSSHASRIGTPDVAS